MPYQKNQDLPESVKDHLPAHAQDIYREAFNNAYQQYQDPDKRQDPQESLEEISHRVAWSAVKKNMLRSRMGIGGLNKIRLKDIV